MRRSIAAIIAALLVVLAAPASATATPDPIVLDFSLEGTSVAGLSGESEMTPGRVGTGQSMMFPQDQTVTAFELYVFSVQSEDYSITTDMDIQVWEGQPGTGQLIYDQTQHGIELVGDPNNWGHVKEWVTFETGLLPVAADTLYTFTAVVPDPLGWYQQDLWQMPRGIMFREGPSHSYTDGHRYDLDEGSTSWISRSGADYMFRVRGGYPIPSAPASWTTLQSVDPPQQTLLAMDPIAAPGQSGWSYAAAATALIDFHRNEPVTQCDFVKDTFAGSGTCPSGTTSPGDVAMALGSNGLSGATASQDQTVEFEDIKPEIDAGRP